MRITLELLPHEIDTVRTLVNEITTALGVALANVHDDYSHSVVTAEQPKTLPPITVSKPGSSTATDSQSVSTQSPLSAEVATVSAESKDQTKRRYSYRPSHITQCQVDDCDKPTGASVIPADGRTIWVCTMHRTRWYHHGTFLSRAERKAVSAIAESVHKSNAEPVSLVKVGSRPPANDADRLSPSEGAELTFSGAESSDGRDFEHSEADVLPFPLTDDEFLERFSGLIDEAAMAFYLDSSYCSDIIASGRRIRQGKRGARSRAA